MASPHQVVIRAVRYSVSTYKADNLLFGRMLWLVVEKVMDRDPDALEGDGRLCPCPRQSEAMV